MAGQIPVAKRQYATAETRAGYPPQPPQRKRAAEVIDLTGDDDDYEEDSLPPPPKPKRRKTTTVTPKKSPKKVPKQSPRITSSYAELEIRERRWRNHPPAAYNDRYYRALEQRMFVLDRTRPGTRSNPTEKLTIAGSTGNLYTVTIDTSPRCTCPDNLKGNQCKHIIYALVRVLKAPRQLQYQLAFLPSELRAIFAAAPLPAEEVSEDDADAEHPNNRKPMEGDCPICFCDMEEAEGLVWCKAACGNNVHKSCFEQWARSCKGTVRCVYCRADWVGDGTGQGGKGREGGWKGGKRELAALRAGASVGVEGYVNVGAELGLDSVRDDSTYHGYGYW